MKHLILLCLFFNSVMLSAGDVIKPEKIPFRQKVLAVKSFEPYCSRLLNDNCFIFPDLYVLGYSKKNHIAYIVHEALDSEDEGDIYRFIIQDLNTDNHIIDIRYRYDSGSEKMGINETITSVYPPRTLLRKTYRDFKYQAFGYDSFALFWHIRGHEISKRIKIYGILSKKNKPLIRKQIGKITYRTKQFSNKRLFPYDRFIKELDVYRGKKKIYSKRYKDYFYGGEVIMCWEQPYTKNLICILSSIRRGATGMPHLVRLDIFAAGCH